MLTRAYMLVSAIVLAALAAMAFRQPGSPNMGEITVERINVVDRSGTLRMVISNKDRMHPGVMDGITIERPRPVAGMLFFNDEGDEVGGLTYTGRLDGTRREASGSLTFDQLKQDQTIGFRYSESAGRRTAALEVWDRSDAPLSDLIRRLNEANRIPDEAERTAAVQKARREAPPAPRRIFVGKNADRAAVVSLADADGKPRLNLIVDATGESRIEFLGADGRVVNRIPPK
jgi:hypothetical protein